MGKISIDLGYDCLRVSTPCTVITEHYVRKQDAPVCILCDRADWDTGATVSVISERLVQQLGLIPVGKTKLSGFNGRPVITNEYILDLSFGDDVTISFVRVAEAPLVTMDLLVGMNVINQGDFHILFRNGHREFTFEVD